MFDGDHNDERPEPFVQEAVQFFVEKMRLQESLTEENKLTPEG